MDHVWDAGDTGCGYLATELHRRLTSLAPGERLRVLSRDPGAVTDIPAWCRMAGHRLISADDGVYVIERKPA